MSGIKNLPGLIKHTPPGVALKPSVVGGAIKKPVSNPVLTRQLDVIDVEFAPVVEKRGVKGLLAKFGKSKPAQVSAALVGGGLISATLYDELIALADKSGDQGDLVRAAIDQIEALKASAGLDDPTPDSDGLIGQVPVDEMRLNVAMFNIAREQYQRACAAVGGATRLRHLMEWLTVDSDLQDIVLEAEDND